MLPAAHGPQQQCMRSGTAGSVRLLLGEGVMEKAIGKTVFYGKYSCPRNKNQVKRSNLRESGRSLFAKTSFESYI
jgi:hypothetical protein